ncbi:hypothetical protein KUTeg_016020 [Tegillarca granosa]|uniref:Uncharacterized protein n=1 Tax=Tegillarca granosa TaxID=220873 RepID=A0ABQ9EPY7_TEGGR|nr:hypothetical protein KUTeg_016020 [Tegillarca granosa]
MNLHYEHVSAPSPDVDFLPLHIELYDPSLSDEVIEENFYLPIHIKGALPNSPPMSSHMNMYMMDVDQFVLSTMIPGVIKAVDSETKNSQLVYNISQPLRQGEGYFVNLDDHTIPISSFLQDDLQNHRIAYQPPNASHLERRVYECKFVVFDSHFANSLEILLHISVRPSGTTAPRISYLRGLVLLEGQSRPITNRNIQIVDRDNIDRVRIYVRGGLQYGRLEINGRRTMSFSVRDLESETVIYYHDDSDSTNDQIDIRISDGVNTVLANFPITIIPKDDSPPYIVNNLGLELNEGEIRRIRSQMLMATDTDSVDKNIVYDIVQPPGAGEIIRRIRPTDVGTRVNKFVQRDVIKGQIFYRHFGHEVFTDSFTFRLKDHQDPPNKSGLETFHIRIKPVNENPPQLSPEATRLMHVLESDIAYITTAELQYTDVETDDNQLTYTITSPPYFVYSNGPEDAGRIIATHNVSMVMKDPNLAPIRTFKQEDINHMKIAYMPPMDDIGPQARLVRFVYTVQDSNRNKVLGQYFDIDIQPVNNQAPSFVASKLLVEEGGILGISNNQLSATDADTMPEELTFILDEVPLYGVIQKSGNSLGEDGTFTLEDLQRADIRYVHGGSDMELDSFTLTVNDGVNRATKVFTVDIIPTDDRAPQLRDNLRSRLIVSEGGEAVVTSSVLAATDDDTDDSQLVFLIVKQPKHGVMQLDGQPATKFTQQEVEDRHVKYIHTGGREVFVNESGSFTFTPDVVTAKDPDTAPEKISFMIVKQPQWGYVENVKPNPGSEKSNAGIRISSFKLQDIIDNTINYVQSNHRGVEPVYDELQFYATDGRLQSTVETFGIRIIPQNDEEPDIMLKDFVVDEGGSVIIDKSMVDVIDMDMPKDQIRLSISQPPEHGDIVVMLQTKNGDVEAAVQDFSIDELHSGMQLKYRHDDSEHFRDNFAITVSDGRHEVKKMCNITISSMNDERPEVSKNAGLQLEYGDYAMISSMSLQSVDPDNSENEIYYILVSLPRKGSLQYCSNPFSPTRESECEDLAVGMNFTQHDVDMNRIRYIHTTSMGSSESDSFLFLLSDGINKRQVETFEIRIRNSQKANLALLNKGLNVREGERTPLSTANLSASDESTKAEEIVFAIIRPPSLGQIEYINKPLTSISSFTQLDLATRRIVYNHLTKSDITKDSFTFTVTNGLSQAKDGEFVITIDPLDRILPSLKANELIEVVQGGEVQITSSNLRAQDPDTSEINVTYIIAKPPTYGHLLNRDVVITRSFTQHDIDLGYISYESESSHTGLANFLFTITDGRHDGFLVNGTLHTKPIICSIFVKPLVNDAPKLLTVKSPDTLEYFGRDRYGFRLNNRNLKAVDSDTVNSRLMYVMTRRPRHGRIENVATKRYVRRRFSQKDLDDNSLLYIVNQRDQATNDSFTFRLIDGRGNSIDNQRFQMRWSTIEFVKTYIVVCEDIGTLTITLKRTGSLEAMAFVGISVKEMSAKEGRDFIPSTAQQVQFNPEPVNGVLGKRQKVNIRIINAENGNIVLKA